MRAFTDKIQRRLSRVTHRHSLPAPIKSVVSFGFDDCPRSVLENALPLLEAEGWRATIYVAVGLCGIDNHLGKHLSKEDIQEIAARGHEIADHSYSHESAMNLSVTDYMADIERNQAELAALGIPPSRHFAFPYGDVTPALKKALSKRFLTSRGIMSPEDKPLDANLLSAMRLYAGEATDAILARIQGLNAQPEWLHLFSHDVRDNPSEYGCTVDDIRRVISALRETRTEVMTVEQAYDHLYNDKQVTA